MDGAYRDLFKTHLERNAAWAEVRDWRKKYDTNDRAGVLVIAAILDQALQSAIVTHCVTPNPEILFDFQNENGSVLSTTSAKINIAYHLGILPAWMKDDLRLINDIRNAFAHSPQPLNFENEAIAAKCTGLSSSRVHYYRGPFFEFIGQRNYAEWADTRARGWGHSQHRMGEVGSPEFDKNIREYQKVTEAGPAHSDNDRNRFWVICTIIFSYLKYEFADAGPLKFSTSKFYESVISAAAPPP